MLDRFFFGKVDVKTWTLFMLLGIPIIILATSILVSSVQSSLSFTPMKSDAKASGVIMSIGDVGKDYPDFKPDTRFSGMRYKEATVQYAYGSQFYNLKLAAPVPDVGKHVGDTVPLLVDTQNPANAVADIYPTPYNVPLIVFMSILNAVGLSLVVIGLIHKRKAHWAARGR